MSVTFPAFRAYDVETLRARLALADEESRGAQIECDTLRDKLDKVYAFLRDLGEMFDRLAAASPTCARLFEDMALVRELRAMLLEDCRSRKGRHG
jgi:hypothetical protein